MEPTTPAIAPITVARAEFLHLVIPQLWAGGFTELAARYSVELDRLKVINATLPAN